VRVGIGFDAHRFGGPGPLLLGGVAIPFERGLEGHSDADVLAHAVADAVLGAAGLGDLGELFGADDALLAGADSLALLSECVARAARTGGEVLSADATIVAQAPRLAPHRAEMAGNLSRALGCAAGVKATTTDRMGFTGRGEGIAALAVVLLR
jgi:2-C-methyl-D-erythritol 2,4-cyclodiphosphate synthase